jgi:hypothetical protein
MVRKIGCEKDIAGSLAGLDEITRPIHNLRITEARVTFWSAIALLGIGTVILVVGAFGSGVPMHSATFATGAFLNLIGGAILKLHRDVHAKLDRFHRDRDQINMILQIADGHARDRAIEACAQSLQSENASWWKRVTGR